MGIDDLKYIRKLEFFRIGANSMSSLRLSVDNSVIAQEPQKKITTWPPKFLIDRAIQQKFIVQSDFKNLNFTFTLNSYVIPYEIYSKVKTPDSKLLYQRFQILRDYFDIAMLIQIDSLLKKSLGTCTILLAHREPISKENIPDNSSQNKKLKNLSNRGDILISFNFESTSKEGFRLKMPIFHAKFIFHDLKLFPNFKMALTNRGNVMGKNIANQKKIKTRKVINRADLEIYKRISDQSYENLYHQIEIGLFNQVKANFLSYEIIKQNPDWRKKEIKK